MLNLKNSKIYPFIRLQVKGPHFVYQENKAILPRFRINKKRSIWIDRKLRKDKFTISFKMAILTLESKHIQGQEVCYINIWTK